MQEKYLGGNVKKKFGISAQHYSFAVQAFVNTVKEFGTFDYEFAVRETKTADVINDVASMKSEIGLLYLSEFNRQVITKLLETSHLEFHHLIDCGVYVYLWKEHPLAGNKKITFAELENYPCLTFEQGDKSSFYFAEEIYSTSDYARVIRASDRSTMLNLMKGLDGYTFCSGIICDSLNGDDYTAVPVDDDSIMEIGYITRKHTHPSEVGSVYIEKLKEYLNV